MCCCASPFFKRPAITATATVIGRIVHFTLMVQVLGKNWNIFRYTADFSHILSIIILLSRMIYRRTCAGVSLKTNVLYLIVFCCRYYDDVFSPPLYNIVCKIFYLTSTTVVILLMLTVYRKTYDRRHDTFSMIALLLVCVPPTLVTARFWAVHEVLWVYSLWLESVAIIPQLMLIRRNQRVDVVTKDYVFFLGLYRLFYVLNWIRKAVVKQKTVKVVWFTGILQTVIYIDFLYYYCRSLVRGTKMELPL